MKNQVITAALPLLFVAGLATAGQPQNPPPQTPPRTPAATAPQASTTLVGCLYREDQVPGRKPNVAERAGVLEDYIIAGASIAAAKQGAPSAKPEATGTSGATPASGNMYKLEGPADEKLKALVGKRVEVTGRIDPEGAPGAKPGAPTPDRGPGPDQINLPEFEVASIREISGTCPAAPAPRK